ncbi:hypothetical protein QP426_03370 [Pauljensenia sp. UMB1235]|nr:MULTISPECIES: hypothetical protein [unclassified Pauljensenia]MDK6400197.1 hypothetical protein [Pauljensenia sp. UMB9872]MDK7172709.1 hypothetical protein [Pauljensenia sp. UMB1235]
MAYDAFVHASGRMTTLGARKVIRPINTKEGDAVRPDGKFRAG